MYHLRTFHQRWKGHPCQNLTWKHVNYYLRLQLFSCPCLITELYCRFGVEIGGNEDRVNLGRPISKKICIYFSRSLGHRLVMQRIEENVDHVEHLQCIEASMVLVIEKRTPMTLRWKITHHPGLLSSLSFQLRI